MTRNDPEIPDGSPRRIRLSRAKGWRKPEGAVTVARPSRWGNPWKAGAPASVIWPDGDALNLRGGVECLLDGPMNAAGAAETFRWWLEDGLILSPPHMTVVGAEIFARSFDDRRARLLAALPDLRGRDLCCWCAIISHGAYVPCHADVLLSLANAVSIDEVIRENTRRSEGAP